MSSRYIACIEKEKCEYSMIAATKTTIVWKKQNKWKADEEAKERFHVHSSQLATLYSNNCWKVVAWKNDEVFRVIFF